MKGQISFLMVLGYKIGHILALGLNGVTDAAMFIHLFYWIFIQLSTREAKYWKKTWIQPLI